MNATTGGSLTANPLFRITLGFTALVGTLSFTSGFFKRLSLGQIQCGSRKHRFSYANARTIYRSRKATGEEAGYGAAAPEPAPGPRPDQGAVEEARRAAAGAGDFIGQLVMARQCERMNKSSVPCPWCESGYQYCWTLVDEPIEVEAAPSAGGRATESD